MLFRSPQSLRTLVLEILLHFSFLRSNADMMLQRNVMQSIESAARGETNVEYVPMGVAIIANLCENIDLHVTIVESPLFEVLTGLIQNDSTPIQQEVIRALMLLSLSPKYHHVILATGVMANVCPIAMTERLLELALQDDAAVGDDLAERRRALVHLGERRARLRRSAGPASWPARAGWPSRGAA